MTKVGKGWYRLVKVDDGRKLVKVGKSWQRLTKVDMCDIFKIVDDF